MGSDEKIRLGISACLLGEPVRYDGGHKRDRYLTDILGQYVEYIPVCPEHECGLPVPREAMCLVGDPDDPRLVTIDSQIDYTEQMKRFSEPKMRKQEYEYLSGFIFKANSPSCTCRSQVAAVVPGTSRILSPAWPEISPRCRQPLSKRVPALTAHITLASCGIQVRPW